MKHSSILMSSFAALLILISVNENALKRTDDLSIPDQTVTKAQPMVAINEASSLPSATPVSKMTKDFSYLKFNVSDFETVETGNYEMPAEVDFDYLKFNVNSYTESLYDIEELPSADLDYLKFDVQKYMQNDSAGKINELPEASKL